MIIVKNIVKNANLDNNWRGRIKKNERFLDNNFYLYNVLSFFSR